MMARSAASASYLPSYAPVRALLAAMSVGAALLACPVLRGQDPFALRFENAELGSDCEGAFDEWTDDWRLTAVGDRVPSGEIAEVELSVTFDRVRANLHALSAILTLGSGAEYVGFVPSATLNAATWRFTAAEFGDPPGPVRSDRLRGFGLDLNFDEWRIGEFVRAGEPFRLGVIQVLVTGEPGETIDLRFQDRTFRFVNAGSCLSNVAYHFAAQDAEQIHAFSTRHVDGRVHIVDELEAAGIDPEAGEDGLVAVTPRVYDAPPTIEEAGALVELRGETAPVGGTVDVELWITAFVDVVGYEVSLRHPPCQLRLLEVVETTRPGDAEILPTRGHTVLRLGPSWRLLGRAGEPIHVATLRFQVLAEAADAAVIPLRAMEFGKARVAISTLYDPQAPDPLHAFVSAAERRDARLMVEVPEVLLGDANGDRRLDLADPTAILGSLFRGTGPLRCPAAGDANSDGDLDIADAIDLLRFLFLSGSSPTRRLVPCVGPEAP